MRYSLLLGPILLTGCVLNQPVPVTVQSVDPQALVQMQEAEAANLEAQRELTKHEVKVVADQPSGADPLSEAVAQMAIQLNVGLSENHVKRLPIAILPFVQLGSKASGTPTGERLSENFIFQLQQHGYNLVDFRAVSLNTTVKDPLSAENLSGIRNRFRIHFVLTGTYSQHPDGIIINARVLDTTSRQILAAAQTNIPSVRLEGELPGYDPIKAMDDGMIIENGTRQTAAERAE
ncbi:FlgO family outer membrane protein [uncultured Amphritea sp.]|uniref:FlgO family outer membrane protein n=1 Tax=uncultured Amphritea sp. TaxID=981605 RepID=UPI00263356A2|nr:FlgO family outer membrane protein [uncultured Amphritea sp.]